MKFKLNPLTGEFDYTSDSANKEKLNPMTGEFNLVEWDGPFSQIFNPLTWTFNLGTRGGGGIIAEVTGNWYINLTNAVANHLMELKAYGWIEQDLTPTPDNPVDIICNNGVLKARHQSWLPIWYTLLDYIKSWWNNYIDTWIKITNEDVIEMQYLQTSDKWAIYWEYYNGTANMSTTLYWNITFYFYAYNAWWTATNVWNYDANIHTVVHNFVDWYIDFDWVRTTFDLPDPNTFTNTLNCPIFWRSNGSSIWYFSKTQLYYFRIRRNWTLILDLIPAKDSDNNIWMYDRVSWTLFTESWSWSFTAWNTVADPMTVYVDWTTETIEDELWNAATAEMLLKIWDYVDEQEILSWDVTRKIGIKVLDWTENWQNISGYFNLSKTDLGSNSTVMPSNSHNIICSHFETKDGTFTDGVGIGGSYVNFKYDSITTVLADWKTWLATQYNAWTPVIIVYPLATPTTESVAGQAMYIPAWDSTIEITQASIDNLWLYAKYLQSN